MTVPRHSHSCTVLDGKLYVVGGWATEDRELLTEVFDPSTGSWSLASGLVVPRMGHSCVAFGGRLYVFGGFNGGSMVEIPEVLDPECGVWSDSDYLPIAPQQKERFVSECAYLEDASRLWDLTKQQMDLA
eukprot:TRINITY_DN12369_c0_g1_i4.p2 TRINITY_DN12369_c0_g1~~TRINITY_DN12369_c0_g1_i4.p2  ORF type:complete len:130 (-),score=20.65 TRINITY_DN12369_c0_g1_i4:68-457(-)